MARRRKLTWIYFLFCLPVFGQDISIITNWDYQRKGDRFEKINATVATTHGFIVAVGETTNPSLQDRDGLFVLLNAETGAREIWKDMGGIGDQGFNSIVQNPNGTFTVVGFNRRDGKRQDAWVVIVDEKGDIIDETTIDVSGGDDVLNNVAINLAGQCIATGMQNLEKAPVPWVLALNEGGAHSTLSPRIPKDCSIEGITADNEHFLLVGTTSQKDKEHPTQIWTHKIDVDGAGVWPDIKYFGDRRGMQKASDIRFSPINGGYIVSGSTNSSGAGKADMWLIKIDVDGKEVWQRTLGDFAADLSSSVVELGTGGFAVFGHTWSYAPKASRSNFKVYITDHNGRIQDEDFDYPIGAEGDAIGYAVVESAASENIVLVGNTSASSKRAVSTTFLTSLQYYQFDLSEFGIAAETFGNASDKKLELSPPFFIDKDQNSFIEEGERGYVEIDVKNPGKVVQTNVVAEVQSSEGPELEYWNKLYLGTIGPGQTRKLRIPVVAISRPRSSNYRLDLNLRANKKHVASTKADIASNTPNPANLVYNKSNFTPAVEPIPGEPIELQIELNNLGGAPTEATWAEFGLPPGVMSEGSEKIMIPSIAPRASHLITFVFSYSEDFLDRDIQLTFEVASTDEMVGLKKSFSIAVPNNQPVAAVVEKNESPASEIIWMSHDTEEFRTIDVNTKQVDLEVIALSNQVMNKRNFAVLINGRRSQGQKLDESKLSRPKNSSANRIRQKYENTISLVEGLNEVQIVYYSENGQDVIGTSAPITFHYIPKDKPNLYVLSIGVKHDDLKYTENDARAIAQMYEQLGGKSGFKKVFIADMVESAETTERSIKKAFLDLERRKSIKDNDLVVVFISSHGKVVDGDRYVLLPSDYDPQYDEIGTIDFNDDVLKRLRNVDGNKLVFIDACHSGSAGSRSFSNEAASKVMNDLINATAGLEIFASCGDREFSYEDDSWEHGAFTKAILEAFRDEIVEVDGKRIHSDIYKEVGGTKKAGSDGVITIEELKLFVQQRVPQLVKEVKNKPQNPTNKSTELLPKDMGIFMVSK